MKRILLFISASLALTAQAQQDKFIVKLNPLALADVINFPTIQAGIETRLSPHISWYNELGIRYINYYFRRADTNFLASRGFKAKTEIRYYFKNSDKKGPPAVLKDVYYVAANAFFIKDVHNTSAPYYYNKDSSQSRVDDFGVKKTIWGMNLIFGYQESMGGRFLLDVYCGLGIRLRQVNTVNKEFDYTRDRLIMPIDYNVNAMTMETEAKGGFSVAPNVSIGLRICYRL